MNNIAIPHSFSASFVPVYLQLQTYWAMLLACLWHFTDMSNIIKSLLEMLLSWHCHFLVTAHISYHIPYPYYVLSSQHHLNVIMMVSQNGTLFYMFLDFLDMSLTWRCCICWKSFFILQHWTFLRWQPATSLVTGDM